MVENSRCTGKGSMELTLLRILEYYFVALELEGKSPKTIDWYR
jgi:hypothetical protein